MSNLTIKNFSIFKNLVLNREKEPLLRETEEGRYCLVFNIPVGRDIGKMFKEDLGIGSIADNFYASMCLTWVYPTNNEMHADLFTDSSLELVTKNNDRVNIYDISINETNKYFLNLALEIASLKTFHKTLSTIVEEKVFNKNKIIFDNSDEMYAAIRSCEYENLRSFLLDKDTNFVLYKNKAMVAQSKKDKILYISSKTSIRYSCPHFLLNFFVLDKSKLNTKLKADKNLLEEAKEEIVSVVKEHLTRDKQAIEMLNKKNKL